MKSVSRIAVIAMVVSILGSFQINAQEKHEIEGINALLMHHNFYHSNLPPEARITSIDALEAHSIEYGYRIRFSNDFFDMEKYNEAFFDNHFLLIYYWEEGTVSTELNISSIHENDDEILIELMSYTHRPALAMPGSWILILEMDRNYLDRTISIIGSGREPIIISPVLPFAPNLPTASEWAHEGITEAYSKGFIPEELQSNYQNVITRAQFCRMAVRWLEYATGNGIDAVLAEKGLTRDLNVFTDTDDPDILAAFALGITNGIGGSSFDPDGQITREQAATMIMRICKAIGADIGSLPPSGFADMENASSWAHDGISFVRANGIMQGAGGNIFNPKGVFTIQENIVAFNNIAHDAK